MYPVFDHEVKNTTQVCSKFVPFLYRLVMSGCKLIKPSYKVSYPLTLWVLQVRVFVRHTRCVLARKMRQHQSTSFFQTMDLAYYVIPTQQASTTLQRAGSSFSWPAASSNIQSEEVPVGSGYSQVKSVLLFSKSDTYSFSKLTSLGNDLFR